MKFSKRSQVVSAAAAMALALVAITPGAHAADWSDTEIQYLYGTRFNDNGDGNQKISKSIITLQHADGWKYGRNFFFVDFLKANDADKSAGEVYGEGYSSFSVSKISGQKLEMGILRDINLTVGFNYGSKSLGRFTGANPRIFLVGPTIDLNLPGFAFFNIDVLYYVDRARLDINIPGGVLNVASCGDSGGGYTNAVQVTPSWQLPFEIGSAKFSFEGFMDIISRHGGCKRQVLTQPQLRLDVGDFFGAPKKVFVGTEWQYWHNKFGVSGRNESFPQLLLVWKF